MNRRNFLVKSATSFSGLHGMSLLLYADDDKRNCVTDKYIASRSVTMGNGNPFSCPHLNVVLGLLNKCGETNLVGGSAYAVLMGMNLKRYSIVVDSPTIRVEQMLSRLHGISPVPNLTTSLNCLFFYYGGSYFAVECLTSDAMNQRIQSCFFGELVCPFYHLPLTINTVTKQYTDIFDFLSSPQQLLINGNPLLEYVLMGCSESYWYSLPISNEYVEFLHKKVANPIGSHLPSLSHAVFRHFFPMLKVLGWEQTVTLLTSPALSKILQENYGFNSNIFIQNAGSIKCEHLSYNQACLFFRASCAKEIVEV